jgi:hypothetical protein
MRKTKSRLPTHYQSQILRRIAITGGLMLTHDADHNDRYSDRSGAIIPERTAKLIIRNGWVIPQRDSMFDLTPQSWVAKTI